jgi:putative transposase
MRKSKFTEAQIVQILAEYDAGASMEELARRNGIHANTIRLWRTKYAGMNAGDLARLKQLGWKRPFRIDPFSASRI